MQYGEAFRDRKAKMISGIFSQQSNRFSDIIIARIENRKFKKLSVHCNIFKRLYKFHVLRVKFKLPKNSFINGIIFSLFLLLQFGEELLNKISIYRVV